MKIIQDYYRVCNREYQLRSRLDDYIRIVGFGDVRILVLYSTRINNSPNSIILYNDVSHVFFIDDYRVYISITTISCSLINI